MVFGWIRPSSEVVKDDVFNRYLPVDLDSEVDLDEIQSSLDDPFDQNPAKRSSKPALLHTPRRTAKQCREQ